jgi:hypothetical protein
MRSKRFDVGGLEVVLREVEEAREGEGSVKVTEPLWSKEERIGVVVSSPPQAVAVDSSGTGIVAEVGEIGASSFEEMGRVGVRAREMGPELSWVPSEAKVLNAPVAP